MTSTLPVRGLVLDATMIGPCLSACFAGVTGRDRYTLGFVADVAMNLTICLHACLAGAIQ